jgi:hypothetical protein
MGARLTDPQIELVCREVLARESVSSVRMLRAALRARFGRVGRSERIASIWRRMSRPDVGSEWLGDDERMRLLARVGAAEERTRLAEEREQGHQDRWASEVYELREALRVAKAQRGDGSLVHQRYHDALVKIAQLERRVGELEAGGGRAPPSGAEPGFGGSQLD